MENNECPCRTCPRAITCNWTCDKLNEWAEDKTFAQIGNEFVSAAKRAEKQRRTARKEKA